MLHTEPITTQIKALVGVTCDFCGESICETPGIPHQFEFAVVHANWGYGSDHDGDSFEAHICERCVYEKLLPQMKVKPDSGAEGEGNK